MIGDWWGEIRGALHSAFAAFSRSRLCGSGSNGCRRFGPVAGKALGKTRRPETHDVLTN
jgi:hypothetical protein